MIVQAALALANDALRKGKIEDGPRDARRIMAAILKIGPDRLTLHLRDTMTGNQEEAFFSAISDRVAHVPVSRIVGGRLFYDRWFQVTPDVLDPRPETEILVQEALTEPFSHLLDLGTGSGAILVTLLAEQHKANGTGTDVSSGALAVAMQNANSHEVLDRCNFEKADWLDGVEGTWDLIVSNPPYIAADEMSSLAPEVRDHDPAIALTDTADGLSAYARITSDVMRFLTPSGRLIVEIGPTQSVAVSALLDVAGFAEIRVIPDMDGRHRVVMGRKPAN